MADYTPVYMPGTAVTLQASAAVTGGDLVVLSGVGTVAKAAALASTAYVGVAGHDAGIGQKVTVHVAKAVYDSISDGSITAGDQVTTTNTANRQVKALAAAALNVDVTASPTEASIEAFNAAINTAVNNARGAIGTAVTSATDNTTVRWVQR